MRPRLRLRDLDRCLRFVLVVFQGDPR
jgi:hypothetical protein